ncbi:hypothetical protein BC829DRAFT_391692, partial [Chytridium lagenaria]
MPRFTQTGLVARLVYAKADYVTPCTSIQNVDWEAHIGGGKHGNQFDTTLMRQKINPVLNGMDLSKFSVKRHLEAELPTAVMLSHISPLTKEPPYTTECQAAIVNMNLTEKRDALWSGKPVGCTPNRLGVVNSSITEGLPLALGEAGLCGLPVACTDVGGSREVVSNMAKGEVYGAIVPPSKPRQLAMAQLKILAMTDGLSRVADPTCNDVEDMTLEALLAKGVEQLEKRIADARVNELR